MLPTSTTPLEPAVAVRRWTVSDAGHEHRNGNEFAIASAEAVRLDDGRRQMGMRSAQRGRRSGRWASAIGRAGNGGRQRWQTSAADLLRVPARCDERRFEWVGVSFGRPLGTTGVRDGSIPANRAGPGEGPRRRTLGNRRLAWRTIALPPLPTRREMEGRWISRWWREREPAGTNHDERRSRPSGARARAVTVAGQRGRRRDGLAGRGPASTPCSTVHPWVT